MAARAGWRRVGTVRWYSPSLGYGLLRLDSDGLDLSIRDELLVDFALPKLLGGKRIVCNLDGDGTQIVKIVAFVVSPSGKAQSSTLTSVTCIPRRFDPNGRCWYLDCPETGLDAIVSLSTLRACGYSQNLEPEALVCDLRQVGELLEAVYVHPPGELGTAHTPELSLVRSAPPVTRMPFAQLTKSSGQSNQPLQNSSDC